MNKSSFFQSLMILLSLIFAGLIVAMFIPTLLKLFFNDYATNINALKTSQCLSQIVTFLIPSIVFIRIKNWKFGSYIGLYKKVPYVLIIFGILMYASAFPLVDWLSTQNTKLVFPDYLKGVETWMKNLQEIADSISVKFLAVSSTNILLVNILVLAIIPAICEEFLFRAAIQNMLVEKLRNYHLAIIIGAIIFSTLHLEFYGFFPRVILGLILGYVYFFTKNLFMPILIHFINNLVVVVTYFYYYNYVNPEAVLNLDQELMSTCPNIYFALGSLLLCGLFFLSLRKYYYKNVIKEH